jgi:hypothetical protein
VVGAAYGRHRSPSSGARTIDDVVRSDDGRVVASSPTTRRYRLLDLGPGGYATAIDGAGTIAADFGNIAAVWEPSGHESYGPRIDLPFDRGDGSAIAYAMASDIGPSGIVVGASLIGSQSAVLWKRTGQGAYTMTGPGALPGHGYSGAYGIDARGTIAGMSSTGCSSDGLYQFEPTVRVPAGDGGGSCRRGGPRRGSTTRAQRRLAQAST